MNIKIAKNNFKNIKALLESLKKKSTIKTYLEDVLKNGEKILLIHGSLHIVYENLKYVFEIGTKNRVILNNIYKFD